MQYFDSQFDSQADFQANDLQVDPLNSPFPVPWNWILAAQDTGLADEPHFFRSASLLSPDGRLAAYSRIRMDGAADLFRCRVSSVLFIENLETGTLQVLSAHSPLACDPWRKTSQGQEPGAIAILIPIGWNAAGTQLLAREFEGMFCSSEATDYAVVWDRCQNTHWTLNPQDLEHDCAILLGWSDLEPTEVLFRVGCLGDRDWPVVAVSPGGIRLAEPEEQGVVFGQVATSLWMGPQASAS